MPLVPAWAPNVHPMLIHFPIVLAFVALLVDVAQLVRPRPERALPATLLFALGALGAAAAYLTGRAAASTVFMPGMAHGLASDHEQWALATTATFAGIAALRVAKHFLRVGGGVTWRVACVVGSLLVAGLVQQTAERGARLVYEQGVGVRASAPAPLGR